jgi:hypothetical protein
MTRSRSAGWVACLSAAVLIALVAGCSTAPSPEEAKTIAEEAYVFAYPMLENYKTMYVQAVDQNSGVYRGSFNEIVRTSKLLGADFTEVVTPNNDTFYDFIWLDLRTEPMVLSVPSVPLERYYSFQFVDLYTHNFGYIGSRATGTGAGNYLIAGPGWVGEQLEGVDGVFQSEGDFVFALGRTQVNGLDDTEEVIAIQEEYRITSLSEFLGAEAPAPAPTLEFPPYDVEQAQSAGFIAYVNFLLGHLKPDQSEKELLRKLESIGIEPGEGFDPDDLDPALRGAINQGVASALKKIEAKMADLGETKNGWQRSVGVFGDRKEMEGKYLVRAAGAMLGLYGNTHYEAFYPAALTDADGEPLDGSAHSYVMRIPKEQLPAVRGFWSITMYRLPEKLFVPNSINRYSIGDRTPGLRYARDGSLTIYVQQRRPGGNRRANWLPAPVGPFYMVCRLYWPKDKVFIDEWAPASVKKAR